MGFHYPLVKDFGRYGRVANFRSAAGPSTGSAESATGVGSPQSPYDAGEIP